MNSFFFRSILALATFTLMHQAGATTPPVSRIEATASIAMERKLDHQLNKHVTFPLTGAERMDGAVLVSFVVDIEGRLKIVDAETTNPALRDHVLRQLEKVDIGDNPSGTWKIERRRFVFRPEA